MGNPKINEKSSGAPEDKQNGIWEDPRFSHLVSDPRFKKLPKSQRKVKIDKRFEGMFSDKKFKVKYTVDKYGRKVNQSSSEDLKKYYDLNSSAEEEEEVNDEDEAAQEEAEKRQEELAIAAVDDKKDIHEVNENDTLQSDGEEVPQTLREKLLDPDIDYARGEGRLLTDSSSDEESSEDDNNEELFIEHVWGEIDNDAETTEESTRRLAVCNMDWDRIRSQDIMMLCSSFVPPGGSILSVKIYPSLFGKERMAEEEQHGPKELVDTLKNRKNENKKANSSDSEEEDLVQEQDSDAEQGDDYHMEKLRQYQLNRLRYYYAVLECDSIDTADKIYQECDGLEYESTATKLDLRFIPDDTTFDEEEPRDVCTELPDMNQYKPRPFVTTALQQAKVDLTWDETNLERQELSEKLSAGKLDEVSNADLRKIVAFSSEEEDDDDDDEEDQPEEIQAEDASTQTTTKKPVKSKKINDSIAKYKSLLLEISEKEKQQKNKFGMECSWDVAADTDSDSEEDILSTTANLTPIEKVLQKRSEKNKKRKEERKMKKLTGGEYKSDDLNSDSDVPDAVDMNDPYFAEEFANGDFVQPKTKKQQKLKKKRRDAVSDEDDKEAAQQEKELQLLLDDDDENDIGKNHFSLEKIIKADNETKSKKRRKKQLKKSKKEITATEPEDNFNINVDDNRFAAIYTSHLFNIDPTDSHFKKTKGLEKIIQEKLKRRHGNDPEGNGSIAPDKNNEQAKRPKKQIENNLLIKSLKRKIEMKNQK